MSFSSDIKEKLCQYNAECPRCLNAEIAGMIRTASKTDKIELKLKTENEFVAKRIVNDICEVFGISVDIAKGTRNYSIIIDNEDETENIKSMIYGDVVPFDCCRASYIRGAFLGCGSISDPNKNYHIEFTVKEKAEAKFLHYLIEEMGLNSKLTDRKGNFIVYLKGYEDIADMLGTIGASMAALELFNVQIEKEMRNNVNRRVNCENANTDKIAKATSKHLWAINKIKEMKRWDKLPDTLKEIGDLRVEFPEDSLKELGERLEEPIGKSGVNHRLNRILEYAQSPD